MKYSTAVKYSGSVLLAMLSAQALSQPPEIGVMAQEIADTLKGKTCTSGAGATFSFTDDGHYAYSGLWKSGGHYVIVDGAIIVTFDSGLERSFAISKDVDNLRVEQTAVVCVDMPSPVL